MIVLGLSFVAVLATAIILNAVFPLKSRLGNWLAIACLVYAQIVLLSEVLSELRAIGRVGFIVGHLVLLALAVGLWWRRGRPDLRAAWWFGWGEIKQGIRQHRLLTVLVVLVFVGTVVNLGLSIVVPTAELDEMAYHVPRAYFWIQNTTARPYPAEDTRQNEFPANPSLAIMWVMLLSGGYTALNLPQWLSGLGMAVGAAGLARRAGHSRAASVFAGLLLLTFSGVVMQMATKNNDAVVGFTAAAMIYFVLAAVQAHAAQVPLRSNFAVAYMGIAFGLMMGTKLTAFVLLPGVALALLVYIVVRLRIQAAQLVLSLIGSALVGLALFGSYTYIWNAISLGNPLGSREVEDSSVMLAGEDEPRPELFSLGDNLLRYIYQVMNWSQFIPANNFLYQGNLQLFRTAERVLGLNLEAASEFNYQGMGLRDINFITGGFGLIAYLALIFSPLFGVYCLLRARHAMVYLLSGLFIIMVWGWLIAYSAVLPWSHIKTRYFSIFLPILAAGMLPWLYVRRRLAWVWLLPIMALGIWTLGWTTTRSLDRPDWIQAMRDGTFSPVAYFSMSDVQLRLLRENFPPGHEIGVTGTGEMVSSLLFLLPEYDFVSPRKDQLDDYLNGGIERAALWMNPSSSASCDETGRDYLPFFGNPLIRCVFLSEDVQAFLLRSAHLYGFDITDIASDRVMYLYDLRFLVDVDSDGLGFRLPTSGLDDDNGDHWAYAHGTITQDAIAQATCNHQPVEVVAATDKMMIAFPQRLVDSTHSIQNCDVRLGSPYSKQHSLEDLLDLRDVKVVSTRTPPAPDSAPDFVFGAALDLLAFAFKNSSNQVQQCDRLAVASWWQAQSVPDKDYHVTFVLTDDTGIGRARSDHLLSDTPPTQWQTGTTMIDRAFIPIPCDLPPGSYNLLVGVYDVDTVQNLDIATPDGASVGALAYLTTIEVQAAG